MAIYASGEKLLQFARSDRYIRRGCMGTLGR